MRNAVYSADRENHWFTNADDIQNHGSIVASMLACQPGRHVIKFPLRQGFVKIIWASWSPKHKMGTRIFPGSKSSQHDIDHVTHRVLTGLKKYGDSIIHPIHLKTHKRSLYIEWLAISHYGDLERVTGEKRYWVHSKLLAFALYMQCTQTYIQAMVQHIYWLNLLLL